MMRRFLFFCVLPLISGCSQLADHGPVSARTQVQMEALALSREEFQKQVQTKRSLPKQPVTMPFEMKLGVPVLQAQINGQGTVPMMMDTGASRSLTHAATAVKMKVNVLKAADATVEMQGVVGKENARVGLLNPLVLGGWSLPGYPCLVRTYENRVSMSSGASAFPESLLGFDVAQQHCSYLMMDYRNKRLTFGFRDLFQVPKGKRVAYAPFVVKKGVPFITLESGGKKWEAIVDSGSFNGIEISEEVAAQLGVQNQGETVHGLYLMAVGGTVSSSEARLRTVKMPDLTLVGDRYRDVEVDISPGPPRVGSHFLKDYRVTFDFRRKRLWLEW